MDSESMTRDHPAFAPMVVGHTESHRARVASAHDETREEPGPGLRQEAQIVLREHRSSGATLVSIINRRSIGQRIAVALRDTRATCADRLYMRSCATDTGTGTDGIPSPLP